MNQQDIKNLERELWDAADDLRANSKLTAAEYKDPLLGLVLLRFAQNRYEDAKIQVDKNLRINPRTGEKRAATKNDFAAAGAMLLPEKAKYDYLAKLPESAEIATEINEAMKLIEAEYLDLAGVLPKNYHEFGEKLLRDLVRVFNKDSVRKASGDVFGRIYEFFLMKFSMQGAGAQEGGEFFTPPSLVNLIVHFIQPDHGVVHDPACGSGGMFVQTAHFIEDHSSKAGKRKNINEAITVYGTELKSNNTRLAKMNLAIHGMEGKISENNSFYTDPHNLVGKCDFVMANPPFNVDKVDAKNKFLTEDSRLPFGAPLTGKGTVSNGNYLWIQYFYAYLNATGRAGFVMASSATDAGHGEKRIRQEMIDTDAVECIVSISNNFFYTRSLPCHVWFFNKGKKAANKGKILMIDARNTYRVVNNTINDFSDGQLLNLTTMLQSFRGADDAVTAADNGHREALKEQFALIDPHFKTFVSELKEVGVELKKENWKVAKSVNFREFENSEKANEIYQRYEKPSPTVTAYMKELEASIAKITAQLDKKEINKKAANAAIKPFKEQLTKLKKPFKIYKEKADEFLKESRQRIADWEQQQEWFPEGKYADIEGLCKIVEKEEVKELDFSLTPGLYVGVKVNIDMDFDYKSRINEINSELKNLNSEANNLMLQIQKVEI